MSPVTLCVKGAFFYHTEAMRLRKHVRIFYNDDNLATIADRDRPLQPGDRLQVLQAVSGG